MNFFPTPARTKSVYELNANGRDICSEISQPLRKSFAGGLRVVSRIALALSLSLAGVNAEIVLNGNDIGAGSLRQAILDVIPGGSITFDPTLSGDVITLNSELLLNKGVTIDASSLPDGLTISGGGSDRIFRVDASGNLMLRCLTLSSGNGVGAVSSGSGGAIYNSGIVTLERCTLNGNTAALNGGAILNTLSATLTITSSTLSGNSSSQNGGAIANFGTVILESSTLSSNAAVSSGGGIYNPLPASLTLYNTIVAGNTPATCLNIAGNWSGNHNLTSGSPMLGVLSDNGGPTQTMLPLLGSPAIDAGGATVLTIDQRGLARVLKVGLDIGACETTVVPNVVTNDLTIHYNPTGLTIYGRLADADSDGVFEISTDSLFRPSVTTYAGTGASGFSDGARLSSQFNNPSGVAQDSEGNIFIADTTNNRIRMIDATSGAVSTIAGDSTGAFGLANGPGANAKFAFPTALAVGPDDNVYVSDTYNHRICRLTRPPSPGGSWTVENLAGPSPPSPPGTLGFLDATGSSARFRYPYGLVLDGDGNVYVADSGNHRIRKITPLGAVTTYAGSGTQGYMDSATASLAQFDTPRSVAFYNDSVYVADTLNHCIREILPNGSLPGAVSTFAGIPDSIGFVNGSGATAQFNTPSGIVSDGNGRLYVADENNHAIREVLTSTGAVANVAGTSVVLSCVTTNASTTVTCSSTSGLEVGMAINGTNITIGTKILEVTNGTTFVLSAPAVGSGTVSLYHGGLLDGLSDVAQFNSPTGVLVALDGNLLVADSSNHVIRHIDIEPISVPYSVVSNWDGASDVLVNAVLDTAALNLNPGVTYYFRWKSTLNTQTGIYPPFPLYDFPSVATLDASNITPTSARLNATVDPKSSATTVKFEYSTDPDLLNPYEVSAFVGSGAEGFANGTGVAAEFSNPSGVVTDACGDVFVADRFNHRIRRITAAGVVTTFAGSGAAGFANGTGTAAIFERPSGIAIDNNGNFYVADEYNHCIRMITPSGVVTTFAGDAQSEGFLDAAKASAKFSFPRGVAVDSANNVYVADTGNHRIRRIDAISGAVTTLAGTGGAGFVEGAFATSELSSPQALAVTSDGRVLVADTGNHRIRMIDSGVVSTYAGAGSEGFLDDVGANAQFSSPTGIALNALDVAYVTDEGNHRIRRIGTNGVVTTFAGSGISGTVNSPAGEVYPITASQFDEPSGIGMDTAGSMYITQQGLVRKIARSATLPTVTLASETGSGERSVFASISSLRYGSTYYFRASGTNARGLTTGGILEFVTTQAKILVCDGDSVSDPAILHDQSAELDFGITPKGQSVTRTFTISNPGSSALTVTSISVPAGYLLTSGIMTPIPALDSATFQVSLTAVNGTVTYPGNIIINSDAHGQPEFSFPVTGLVLNPPVVTTHPVSDADIIETVMPPNLSGTATFNATVNPQDSDTSVWFEWSVDEDFDGVYVTTVAGDGNGYMEGVGLAAQFNQPSGMVTDANGNIYIADTLNHRIRKIDATTKEVTTFAGSGVAGYANGVGASALFNEPVGLAINADGVLFVADSKNHRIRAIDLVGAVSTYSGAEEMIALTGCATTIATTTVTCANTAGLVVDMYINGTNISTGTKIVSINPGISFAISNPATATGSGLSLTAVSNYGSFTNGDANAARFHTPLGLTIDGNGVLYVADSVNHRIRKVETDGSVSTLSGTGVAGYGNGLGAVSTFTNPVGIAVDSSGNLYVTEAASHAIRKIEASGLTSVFAGSTIGNLDGVPAVAQFNYPVGLVVGVSDKLYVADSGNHSIRTVDQDGNVKTLAGTSLLPVDTLDGYGDIPNTQHPLGVNGPVAVLAQFASPISLATTASGEVIVGESGSSVIREISPLQVLLQAGPVLSGTDDVSVQLVVNGLPTGLMTYFYRAIASNGGGTTPGTSLQSAIVYQYPVVVTEDATDLTPTSAQLNATVDPKLSPTTVVFTYSTDPDLLKPYEVLALAGSGVAGFVNDTGVAAQFSSPSGVVADAVGDIYVADRLNHRIRKVTQSGVVTTFAGSGAPGFADETGSAAQFQEPSGIARDSNGNFYVADQFNHRIRMITPAGVVTTFAGTGEADFLDGAKSAAKFLYPMGVAVDADDNVYVADTGNHRIRMISAATGQVTTIGGAVPGDFSSPQALVVMANNQILVADTGNHRIRMIDSGVVSTRAGNGVEGYLDGPGASAQFASPTGITRDSSGVAYVTDEGNHRIRRIATDGTVTTLAGSGLPGNVNSPVSGLYPATACRFDKPAGICIDASGSLFVTQEGLVRKIARRAALPTVTVTPNPTGSGARLVSADMPEPLLYGTTYYFRAAGTNGRGLTTGDILSFVTLEAKILVFDGSSVSDPAILHDQATDLDFGTTPKDETVTRSFTISNPGNWPLSVNNVTVPTGYALDTLTGFPWVIAPLDSFTFEVTLLATSGNTYDGNVVINCDAHNQPDVQPGVPFFSIPVTGLVYDPAEVTTLAVSDTDVGTATFNATVNPRGSNTTVWFEWSIDQNFDGVFVSTLAGSGPGYVEDIGTEAKFDQPSGMVTDAAGNIYVADTLNHRIRKIDAITKAVTTFAGTGVSGFANGAGNVAQFDEPVGIAMNATGTLFVADSNNHRIRAISASGVVSTYSGTGEDDFTDGLAEAARFNTPLGLAIDGAGLLYVADSVNHRIRKVALNGSVSTLSGTGVAGIDNGAGTLAQFANPVAVAVDSFGNIYVTEATSHAIRRVAANGFTSDYVGSRNTDDFVNANGSAARFSSPVGLVVGLNDRLFVADAGNHRIRIVETNGDVITIAGTAASATVDGYGDIPNTIHPLAPAVLIAQFTNPLSLATSAGGVVVVGQSGDSIIRKISPIQKLLEAPPVIDGSSTLPVELLVTGLPTGLTTYFYRAIASNGGGRTIGNSLQSAVVYEYPVVVTEDATNLTPTSARLNATVDPKLSPTEVVFTYSTDPDLLNPYEVTAIAGAVTPGYVNNVIPADARFSNPSGAVTDGSGNIFVVDRSNHRIRKITPAGVVTTFAGAGLDAPFEFPSGIAIDSKGNLYVADEFNHCIRMIPTVGASAGVVSTFAGIDQDAGLVDDTALNAKFHYPRGVAVDASDNVYVADKDNHRIRKIAGTVSLSNCATTIASTTVRCSSTLGLTPGMVIYSPNIPLGTTVASVTDSTSFELSLAAVVTSTLTTFNVGNVVVLPNCVTTNSSTTVTSFDTSGLITGMSVTGANIAPGTTIASIPNSTSFVLNQTALGSASVSLTFVPQLELPNCITTNASTTVTCTSTSGLLLGMSINGANIAPGTTIVSIVPNTSFVLSQAAIGTSTLPTINAGAMVVTTLAGSDVLGDPDDSGFADGPIATSLFNSPGALAVTSDGKILVADTGNHRVRMIHDGVVSTLAGSGTAGFLDGPGVSAQFSSPTGITLDAAGVAYVTDAGNHRIRRIATDGVVMTVAGSGLPGNVNSPVSGLYPATTTRFDAPTGISADRSGGLIVTQEGLVRKIARRAILPTVTVVPDATGFGERLVSADIPEPLRYGSIYYFRAVGTNDRGTATGDILSFVTSETKILVFDGNSASGLPIIHNQLTAVDFETTPRGETVTRSFTISNPGTWPLEVSDVTVPAGYSLDTLTGFPWVIAPLGSFTFEITLLAGSGNAYEGDVVITCDAHDQPDVLPGVPFFLFPITGIVYDPPILTTLLQTNVSSTFATFNAIVNPRDSSTTVWFEWSLDSEFDGVRVTTLAGSTAGYVNDVGVLAKFDQPSGLVTDAAGNIYVSDTLNHRIRKIDAITKAVTTFSGTGVAGFANGAGNVAQFDEPVGLAMNASGTLFVSDSKNNRIRAINAAGEVSTYCGTGDAEFTDGVNTAAEFNMPLGLAIDHAGVLYVADSGNHRIRKVATDGSVSTLSGTGVAGYMNDLVDDFVTVAQFDTPVGIAVDPLGNVYVTENASHAIRKVAADGLTSDYVGSRGTSGFVNAAGAAARFSNPVGLAVDANNQLYVADRGNHRIRIVESDGYVITVAGTGTLGAVDGFGKVPQYDPQRVLGQIALLSNPFSIATKPGGGVVFGESASSVIRDISSLQVVLPAAVGLNGTVDIPVQLAVTGLPPTGTTYFYRSFATNSGGTTIANGLASKVITFRAWQLNNFGLDALNPLISGPSVSPSGDGVSNLIKYATGLDPFVHVTAPVPVVNYIDGQLSIDWTTVVPLIDVVHTVQWSTDLVNWQISGFTAQLIETGINAAGDPYRVNRWSVAGSPDPAKFIRVIVTVQ